MVRIEVDNCTVYIWVYGGFGMSRARAYEVTVQTSPLASSVTQGENEEDQ